MYNHSMRVVSKNFKFIYFAPCVVRMVCNNYPLC